MTVVINEKQMQELCVVFLKFGLEIKLYTYIGAYISTRLCTRFAWVDFSCDFIVDFLYLPPH